MKRVSDTTIYEVSRLICLHVLAPVLLLFTHSFLFCCADRSANRFRVHERVHDKGYCRKYVTSSGIQLQWLSARTRNFSLKTFNVGNKMHFTSPFVVI